MTPEEKKEVKARLDRANAIEEQIENIESALEIISGGRFYLNACTFQREHEAVSRALSLIEPSVKRELRNKIDELKAEFEKL